jgi:hypothetical protein
MPLEDLKIISGVSADPMIRARSGKLLRGSENENRRDQHPQTSLVEFAPVFFDPPRFLKYQVPQPQKSSAREKRIGRSRFI